MLKRILQRTLLSAVLLLAAACGGRRTTLLADFDRAVYTPGYASGFEIAGAAGRTSTIIRVRSPWQGAEGVETALYIARDGEEAPEGFDGQVRRGDARRIVCLSSTHVAMLDALGADSTIVGVSGIDYLSNPYVAANRDRIGDVGYEGNIDYERLLSLEPDLVLLFGIGGASSLEPKLRELGVPFLYVGEYLEESPLGKAEWMVAVGEAIGRREEAEAIFAEIPERYNVWRERVAGKGLKAPRVMLNAPYGDTWFMASTGSYVARLIADAGGDYLYRRNTGDTSLPIDLEEAALLLSEADVWIHAGSFATLDELRARLPKLADVRCVRAGSVWNCDRRTNAAGGNDYWESGIVHPDLVLRDLILIFHPELAALSEEGDTLVYYRKIE